MYSYVRWLSVIGFIVWTALILFCDQSFKRYAQDSFNITTENTLRRSQDAVAEAWKNTAVSEDKSVQCFEASSQVGNIASGCQAMIEDFSRAITEQADGQPVSAIVLHEMPDNAAISSSPATAPRFPADQSAFSRALKGKSSIYVIQDNTNVSGAWAIMILAIAKPACETAALVQSRQASDDCAVNRTAGTVEIRYDVTNSYDKIGYYCNLGAFFCIVVAGGMFGFFFLSSTRIEAFVSVQHDELVDVTRQLASAREENNNKSQFLANVSHELRTPLNAIIGFSEFIRTERSGAIGNAMYAGYIQDIYNSGVYLLSLINDILDFSKVEAGKLELSLDTFDAAKTVHNSVRLIAPRADDAMVKIHEKIGGGDYIMLSDARKLKQIVLNLLSNAVKFTPPGGSVFVSMWEDISTHGIGIEVRDSGIGIAPKDISRAMMPFGQIENTLTHKHDGTGLGLPLSKKFTEIMGGTFTITSEVGKGTTISLVLPRKLTTAVNHTAI